jgi:hypothetical protein
LTFTHRRDLVAFQAGEGGHDFEARVVDDDVDRPEHILGAFDDRIDEAEVREVGGHRLCAHAQPAQLFRDTEELFLPPRADCHIHTLSRERARDMRPQPARCPRDERDPAAHLPHAVEPHRGARRGQA